MNTDSADSVDRAAKPKIRLFAALFTVGLLSWGATTRAQDARPDRRKTQANQQAEPPSVKRFGDRVDSPVSRPRFVDRKFALVRGDIVVFTGQTDIVRSRHDARLEAMLATHFADGAPRFRNMAWEGDTVYEQWRDLNFGSWQDQLSAVDATVVFAQFGQMEVLAASDIQNVTSTNHLARFIAAYEDLLDQFEKRTRRIVLLSPRPFEKPQPVHMPDHRSKNPQVAEYSKAIAELARRRGYVFVNLFEPPLSTESRLTSNGIHLTPAGQRRVARMIADALNVKNLSPSDALLRAVREKNRLWFDNWRPMNWSFAFGDRTTQPFGKPGGNRPALRVELEEFKPLIQAADAFVHRHAGLRSNVVSGQLSGDESKPAAEPTRGATSTSDHSPEAELASFKVADGFDVNLFASEMDGVVKPLQMRWDDRGRLWVLCAPTYPHIEPGARPADYVLVCEDTDGDGRADKFDRFAEGLFIPMGIEFGDGGVYLCEATELVHLQDTDGDGRADSRSVVLSGFGTADSHQMVNGLGWGPAGELWFSQGHHAYSHVETPWGISRLHKSGLWRYRPRTGQLHSYFNQSSAGLNCQGVTYDAWGQIFHNSAAWSGGFYTVGGMIPTLRPLRYMALAVPDRRNTAIEFLHSEHMPEDLQGAVVWGGFMSNAVQLHRIVDEGSGFTAEVLPDLLTSSRRDFRPVNVRLGPDGALYICDWYNAIIGHYQASYRDPERDRTHGRIWRVTARDRPLVEPVDLEKLAPGELLEQLRSPEGLARYNAKRRLFDLPTEIAVNALDEWLAALDPEDKDLEQLLLRAIGVYEAHEVVRPDILQRLLDADDYRVRAYGTRVIGNWAPRLEAPLGLLRERIHDEHPRVRLEAIVACSYVQKSAAIEVAAMAADLPRDRYIDYALNQCVHALKPYWYPAMARGELRFDGQAERLRLVLELDGTKDVASFIRTLASDSQLSREARDGLLVLLVSVGSPKDLRFALDRSKDRPEVLEELADVARLHNRLPAGDDHTPFVKSLLRSQNEALRTQGVQLAGAWSLKSLAEEVWTIAAHPQTPEAMVVAALSALARLPAAESSVRLGEFAGSQHPQAVQAAAIASICEFDVERAASLAAPHLAASVSQEYTESLLASLLVHRSGTAALAAALREQTLSSDPAKLLHRALSAAGRSDRELLAVVNGAIGVQQSSLPFDRRTVQEMAAEAMAQGDARRGERVFHSQLANCTACHRFAGRGGDLGPDLTIIGAGRSPELLAESVLWPNRQIREGYMSIQVLTDEGRVYTGYRLKETDSELHLKDTSTKQVRRVAKDQIEEILDSGSIMPAGLTTTMTREEVRDLIRFLVEQRTESK